MQCITCSVAKACSTTEESTLCALDLTEIKSPAYSSLGETNDEQQLQLP